MIPVRQSKKDHIVTVLEEEEKVPTKREVEKYCHMIADKALLEQSWRAFLEERGKGYLHIFSPINFIQNRFVKYGISKLGLDRLFIRKKHYAPIKKNSWQYSSL